MMTSFMGSCVGVGRHWVVAAVLLAAVRAEGAGITDFSTWSVTRDPSNALFNASVSSLAVFMTADNGFVPVGTDVGAASVNGTTAAGSTNGHAFSPASSFSLAVTYGLAISAPSISGLALGFGVGEDVTGIDSAGITLVTVGGVASGYLAAGRTNDVDLPVLGVTATNSLTGTFFLSFDAGSGSLTVGVASTPDAAAPEGTAVFSGVANGWDGEDLVASAFLRSSSPLPWTGTSASAVLSNLRVLSGTPVPVPEPTVLTLLLGAGAWRMLRVRRRDAAG